VLGISDVAVQPVAPAPGLAGQPVTVPGDWPSVYAVGVKGWVQDSTTEVAVTEPAEKPGVARVDAWARP